MFGYRWAIHIKALYAFGASFAGERRGGHRRGDGGLAQRTAALAGQRAARLGADGLRLPGALAQHLVGGRATGAAAPLQSPARTKVRFHFMAGGAWWRKSAAVGGLGVQICC